MEEREREREGERERERERERGSWLLYLNYDMEEKVGFFTLFVMWKIELVALPEW